MPFTKMGEYAEITSGLDFFNEFWLSFGQKNIRFGKGNLSRE